MKRESNQNFSGNEVYYTACSLLVISKNSCSKLHCEKKKINSPFMSNSTTETPMCEYLGPKGMKGCTVVRLSK
jgi:hypothetical protein